MFQYETISGSFKGKVAGKNNVPPNTEALIAWMWENNDTRWPKQVETTKKYTKSQAGKRSILSKLFLHGLWTPM